MLLVGQQVGDYLLRVVQGRLDGDVAVGASPGLQGGQPRRRAGGKRDGLRRRLRILLGLSGGGRDWIDSYDWQGVLSSCADHEHLESFGGRR